MALDQDDKDDIVNAISKGFAAAAKSQPSTNTSGGGTTGGGKTSDNKVKKASEGFMRILDEGGGSVRSFAKDFNSMMPEVLQGFGGAVGGIAGYIEDTQGVFQNLSKVGIGLNGNLGELRVQSAKTRMPLDQFANMVSKNSSVLVGLAGNASQGAKRFADLSSAMYDTGAIEGFMNLGYSLEEANEFVLKNTQLTRRQALLTGMTDAQQVESAQELAKNMSVVAKLTGKDAAALQDELIAKGRDGATQAALREMEMDGVKGAAKTFTGVQNILSTGSKSLQNLFSDQVQANAPLTEATQNYAAVNREAADLAQQARDAMARGDEQRAIELAKQAVAAEQEFAQSRQGLQIARLGQISDVAGVQADVLEETGDLIDGTKALQAKIKAATGEEISFREAFNANLKTIAEGQDTQMKGEQPGQEALKATNKAQIALANTASEFNALLGKQIESNSLLLTAYGKLNENIKTQLGNDTTDFLAMLNQMIPGSTLAENIPNIELFSKELKEAGVISATTIDNLKILADDTASAVQKSTAKEALTKEGVLDSTGQISAALAEALLNTKRENMEAQDTSEGSSSGWFSRLWDAITGSTPQRNKGSLGGGSLFENFGDGTLLTAHHLESIQTPSQMADVVNSALSGAMAAMDNQLGGAKFDPASMGQSVASAMKSAPAVGRTGESTENGLDSLNQNVLQLIEINRKTNDFLSKQVRATKGLDGNVMQGFSI